MFKKFFFLNFWKKKQPHEIKKRVYTLYYSKYSYYGDYTEAESTASSFANEYQVSVFSSSFGNKYQFNSSGVIGETLGFIAGILCPFQ